ncbi:hypothetical protein ELY15_08855 [Legionella sp. km772]|nr:hypothetical protein ELY15_08855 [Legionella sp. km772]
MFEKWNPSQVHTAKELGCSIGTTHYSELTEERVLKMKEAGLCVYSYTVDNIDDARRLRDWGVDAIFSNDPTKLALLLEEVCHTSLAL